MAPPRPLGKKTPLPSGLPRVTMLMIWEKHTSCLNYMRCQQVRLHSHAVSAGKEGFLAVLDNTECLSTPCIVAKEALASDTCKHACFIDDLFNIATFLSALQKCQPQSHHPSGASREALASERAGVLGLSGY